jgi:hypothetical protein
LTERKDTLTAVRGLIDYLLLNHFVEPIISHERLFLLYRVSKSSRQSYETLKRTCNPQKSPLATRKDVAKSLTESWRRSPRPSAMLATTIARAATRNA